MKTDSSVCFHAARIWGLLVQTLAIPLLTRLMDLLPATRRRFDRLASTQRAAVVVGLAVMISQGRAAAKIQVRVIQSLKVGAPYTAGANLPIGGAPLS
jgi:hypothetical protein